MSTWDNAQVAAAARVSVEASISEAQLNLPEELDKASGAITDALWFEFHALGLDVDSQDVHFERSHDREAALIKLRGYWMPETNEIELFGGPRDGETEAIPTVGNVLLCAAYSDVPTVVTSAYLNQAYADGTLMVYKLDGWNPTSRRWVYRIVPRREKP